MSSYSPDTSISIPAFALVIAPNSSFSQALGKPTRVPHLGNSAVLGYDEEGEMCGGEMTFPS